MPAARTRPDGGPSWWTRPVDVRTAIRKKWDAGALLARYAAGHDWEPLSIAIRGPSAREIGAPGRGPPLGSGVG